MAEAATPDSLEIYIGSFGAPSYGLWWDGDKLVYESFLTGYHDRRQTFIVPSQTQWEKFWRTLDTIGVWNWRDRYEPAASFEPRGDVRDGTHWSLSLEYGGRRVESAGDTAAPGAADLDESVPFAAFAEAVSRLTGGYAFG